MWFTSRRDKHSWNTSSHVRAILSRLLAIPGSLLRTLQARMSRQEARDCSEWTCNSTSRLLLRWQEVHHDLQAKQVASEETGVQLMFLEPEDDDRTNLTTSSITVILAILLCVSFIALGISKTTPRPSKIIKATEIRRDSKD